MLRTMDNSTVEYIATSAGIVGATLLGRWIWDRATAPERERKVAEAKAEAVKTELEHYGRRVEDRYVLQAVCSKCHEDKEHRFDSIQQSVEQLRSEAIEFREEWRQCFRDLAGEVKRISATLNGARKI